MRRTLLIATLPVALSVLPLAANGNIHTVDCAGGGGYVTIQEAVDAAASGDTILIAPCVYAEQVNIAGKTLTLVGSGAENTELSWSGAAAITADQPLTLSDMSVVRSPSEQDAISWVGGGLTLTDCSVVGRVKSGIESHATCSVTLRGCEVTTVWVSGGGRTSTVETSRIASGNFGGEWLAPRHRLQSSLSTFQNLSIEGCAASSVQDSIGTMALSGGVDIWDSLEAQGSTFGTILADQCPELELRQCQIGHLGYGWEAYAYLDLVMEQCLVSGDAIIAPGSPSGSDGEHVLVTRDFDPIGIALEHNTILGRLLYDVLYTDLCNHSQRYVRSNIVLGPATVYADDCIVITHNDFVGGATISTPSDSVFSNITAEPLFCDAAGGDYSLQECSPCIGTAHDGGDMGAFGVGCDCMVAVETSSWGRIKSFFREGPRH